MAKTYTSCIGMRGGLATRRGGNDGCRASVQSWEGSVITYNWYDGDQLKVRVGTSEESSSYTDSASNDFIGTFAEFKELLKLAADLKHGRAKVVRHRTK